MIDILDAPAEGNELWVFLGLATGASGKPRAMWIRADKLGAMSAEDYEQARQAALWYPKKADTTRLIGGMYELKVERKPDDRVSVWFGTAKYSGQSSHPLIAVFQAADSQARDTEYRRKAEAKASEPVYMRDMERTIEALKALPKRQALFIVDAISIELRRQVLSK